jgi:hypothetical protein
MSATGGGMLRRHWALWLAAMTLATGCNRVAYDIAPVHGKVTVDDISLFQGKVRFAPVAKQDEKNPGKPAFGKIESDGTYRLSTLQANDGAVVGEHWVMVVNVEEDLPDGVPEFFRVTLPDKMRVVSGKENQIDIKLTREVVRKYREDDT